MQDLYLMKFRDHLEHAEAIVKRWWKYVAMFGALLALICPLLPPQSRGVCDVLSSICALR